MANIFTTKMIAAFDGFMEENKPKNAFTSLFSIDPDSISNSVLIELETSRSIRLIATDKKRGSGEVETNFQSNYTNEQFAPPLYNERTPVTAYDMSKKILGNDKYRSMQPADLFAYFIGRGQAVNAFKIYNAIEKMCVQALDTGIITLNNGVNVDFGKDSNLNIVPSVKWDAVSGQDPKADLETLCKRIHQKSKRKPQTAIMDNLAWNSFSAWVIANYKDTPNWIQPGMLSQAPELEGFIYQGTFKLTGFQLNFYTYDDFYETPGASPDAAATPVEYMPANKVIVFDITARRKHNFAATEVLPIFERMYQEENLPPIPQLAAGQITPYFYYEKGVAYAGAQSAPLPIPVHLDAHGTLSSVNT